jgi:hypothetical protein
MNKYLKIFLYILTLPLRIVMFILPALTILPVVLVNDYEEGLDLWEFLLKVLYPFFD